MSEQLDLFGGKDNKANDNNYYIPAKQPAAEPIVKLPFLPGINSPDYTDIDNLDELERTAAGCSRCRLRATCTQVVFGEGRHDSIIMFVGEGPGKDEDISGRPFVGRAGQLLDKILQAADFEREQVYITNVVKCRPPDNRLHNPDEFKQCRYYLEAQIRIMQPKILICLGSMASQVIIDPQAKISKVRGKWLMRQGIKIMATFHPAALLRNESYKRPVWEDFKQIRDEFKQMTNDK